MGFSLPPFSEKIKNGVNNNNNDNLRLPPETQCKVIIKDFWHIMC